MNNLVNIHNDLIDLPLRHFNANEIDLLNTICHKCQEQKTNLLSISFNELKILSNYNNKNNNQFITDLINTNKKLMELNFTISQSKKYFAQFVLFPTFIVDAESEILQIQVHDIFVYLLNNLKTRYTSLELKESANLRSSYAKSVYKKLREYRNTKNPFWKVSVAEFREYLDIPETYKVSNINTKIIKPVIKELLPLFKNLRVESYTDKTSKCKGRKPIAGFIFRFDNENKDSKNKRSHNSQLTQEQIAEMKNSGWNSIPRICPKCHRKIYEKWLSNEFGDYAVYGHPDFKTGVCNFNTYNYADLMEEIKSVKSEVDEAEAVAVEKQSNDTDKEPLENKESIQEKSVPMPDYIRKLMEDWQRKADINNVK